MRSRTLILATLVAAAALPAFAADNRIPIVDEGKLGDQWTLVPGTQLMPPYPEAYAKSPEEVCMVVGYLMNADGTTSDFSLLKSWASGDNSRSRKEFWSEFADLSSRALAQWRYAPGNAASAKPVYTAATFVFGKRDAAIETKQHCEVADLGTRLAELRYNGRAGRMMARGIYSQLAIDPGVEERMRQRSVTWREERDQGQAANSWQNERAAEAKMPQSNK
jgi:hypothetical protein